VDIHLKDKKNFVQIAVKPIKETELLLRALFMKFLMAFLILTPNFGLQLYRF
jgi:hypothetical protein